MSPSLGAAERKPSVLMSLSSRPSYSFPLSGQPATLKYCGIQAPTPLTETCLGPSIDAYSDCDPPAGGFFRRPGAPPPVQQRDAYAHTRSSENSYHPARSMARAPSTERKFGSYTGSSHPTTEPFEKGSESSCSTEDNVEESGLEYKTISALTPALVGEANPRSRTRTSQRPDSAKGSEKPAKNPIAKSPAPQQTTPISLSENLKRDEAASESVADAPEVSPPATTTATSPRARTVMTAEKRPQRVVYIRNLPHEVKLSWIAAMIRGGSLVEIRIMNSKPGTAGAFVTFGTEAQAKIFVAWLATNNVQMITRDSKFSSTRRYTIYGELRVDTFEWRVSKLGSMTQHPNSPRRAVLIRPAMGGQKFTDLDLENACKSVSHRSNYNNIQSATKHPNGSCTIIMDGVLTAISMRKTLKSCGWNVSWTKDGCEGPVSELQGRRIWDFSVYNPEKSTQHTSAAPKASRPAATAGKLNTVARATKHYLASNVLLSHVRE